MQDQPEVNPMSGKSSFAYEAAPVLRPEHKESSFTRMIEQQTAKIPSEVFLFSALSAMGASLVLELTAKTRISRFVGLWVAPLLIMGVYNKLIKSLAPR